ncbi:MAG: FkbM family methyltransferase, partial [Rhodospirillales bacterium]
PPEFVAHANRLTDQSVAIDVGANKGLVSTLLAKKGALVYAFEPNTEAFRDLRKVATYFPNLRLSDSAAGTEDKETTLYLHKDTGEKVEDLSQASSLLSSKPNVSADHAYTIKEIDFAVFLRDIDAPIELIKIDIEGYEVALVNHLLDKADLSRIAKIYVETHDRKWPELMEGTAQMKKRVQEMGLEDKFFFDWI